MIYMCVLIGVLYLHGLTTDSVWGYITNCVPCTTSSSGLIRRHSLLNAPLHVSHGGRWYLDCQRTSFRAHLSGASSQDNHFRAANRKTGKHPQGAWKTGKERVLLKHSIRLNIHLQAFLKKEWKIIHLYKTHSKTAYIRRTPNHPNHRNHRNYRKGRFQTNVFSKQTPQAIFRHF